MSIVKIQGLDYKYRGKFNAIDNLDLELKKNSINAIIGPNGAGKSTLLAILSGQMKGYKGEVLIDGINPSTKEGLKKVAYLPDTDVFHNNLKVGEIVSMYNIAYPQFDINTYARVTNTLDIADDRYLKDLSVGERARFKVAIVMSCKAEVYLLDEPFKGTDLLSRDEIINTLIKNYPEDSCIIIATHELSDSQNIYDNIVFLSNGGYERVCDAEELRKSGVSLVELYKEVYSDVKLL